MLTGWVAFLLAWVSTAMFYKTHPSSVESGTEHKRFLYVFGKKKYLRGYKGERWERIISNGFIFSELSNKMKDEKEEKKETSCVKKLLCCGKGIGRQISFSDETTFIYWNSKVGSLKTEEAMERHRVEEETQKRSEQSPSSKWLSCCKGILQKNKIKMINRCDWNCQKLFCITFSNKKY